MINRIIRVIALMLVITIVCSCNKQNNRAVKDINKNSDNNLTEQKQIPLQASIAIDCKWKTKDNLQISISNQTGNRINFYCSIEGEINGRWRTVIADAAYNNPAVVKKAIMIQSVEPHKDFKIIWFRKRYVDAGRGFTSGEFRVKVTITTDEGDHIGQAIYSAPMKL